MGPQRLAWMIAFKIRAWLFREFKKKNQFSCVYKITNLSFEYGCI